MRTTGILFLLAAASATAAEADGGRVEVHGGYDRVVYERFFAPSDATFRALESGVIGVGLGYDLAIGSAAFAGIEGNADFATGSRCQVNPLILAPGIFESCMKPKRDLSANARIGVNLGEQTRIYALAGYSNLRVSKSSRVNRGPRQTYASENLDGIRVGAGLEHDFGARFYGKVEARYTDYSNDASRTQGLVGVGLRF
jgi:outer membrane immunogenic protein